MGFRKGTGFTNLNKVMTANRGNRLGSAVATGIGGEVQGVQTGIQKSQEEFDKEAQKNRLDTEENRQKRDETIGQFGTQNPINSAQPVQQPSQQQVTDFTKYRTGTYTGPKELQNTQGLYGQAAQTEQLGSLARSGGGRQELLRRFVGGQDYTQGQRTLDESILGQDKTNQLAGAARQTRGALDRVSAANQQASQQAQEYINRAKQFGEETMAKIGEAKDPMSQAINQRVAESQAAEDLRLGNYGTLTDLLSGKGDQYKYLDKATRTGMGIQQALEAGYLSQDQANKLLGDRGLISRAEALKLDTGKLLGERFKSQNAQNIGRLGLASEDEIARLNALDRLAGRIGPDIEFDRQNRGLYQAGNVGFDLGSLEKYISDTEKEKAKADAAYAAKLAAEEAKYMNQLKASGLQSIGGLQQFGEGALGAGMGAVTLNPSDFTAGNAQMLSGAGNVASGQVGMVDNAQNAAIEGLMKLNVGGKSFAKTPAGKAVLAALKQKNQAVNAQRQIGQESIEDISSGTTKLGQGNIGGGVTDLAESQSNLIKNELDQLSRSEYGKAAGKVQEVAKPITDLAKNTTQQQIDIAKNILSSYGTKPANTIAATKALTEDLAQGKISPATKKLLKYIPASELKSLAKVYKGTDLGKTVGKTLSNAVSKLTGGIGKGFKISDENQKENIDYNPKDVENFLSRLKPASYDYKEEVKNDPRASKDRQIGVMAQDLEKSKLGKESVHEGSEGKIVDYKDLEPKMLASLAALHQRLKKLEGKE